MRASRVAVLAVLAFAAVGCTSSEGGEPPLEPTDSDAAEASAVAQLSRRPADLPLAGVDPCALFSKAALHQLKIDRTPRAGAAGGGKNCTLSQQRHEPFYDLLVTAHRDAGVETWISGRMARPGAMEAGTRTIDGFPAVRLAPPGSPPGECEVAVGVASGQALHVRFGTAFRTEIEHQQACQIAEQAAAAAVAGLREKG